MAARKLVQLRLHREGTGNSGRVLTCRLIRVALSSVLVNGQVLENSESRRARLLTGFAFLASKQNTAPLNCAV